MRYTLFILGIASGFMACTNSIASKPGLETELATESAPPVAVMQDSAGTYTALDTTLSFAGVWVNEGYVNDLHITQSPRLAKLEGISCIEIPGQTLKVTKWIKGFHDAAPEVVVVKDGDQYLLTQPDLSKKNVVPIEIYSPTRIKIMDTYLYKLVRGDVEKKDWGILEELLFSGTYHAEDGQEVVFGENGQISGLKDFASYMPIIDEKYEVIDNDVDFVEFKTANETGVKYGYKFRMDTLTLYKVKCLQQYARTKECSFETYGDVVHTLVKEK